MFKKKKNTEIENESTAEDMMFDMFSTKSISEKVEKKKLFEGQLEILKKKQKLEVETISKEFAKDREDLINDIEEQIKNLENQISSLRSRKDSDLKLLAEKLKVSVDEKTKEFDLLIVNKLNQIKRLNIIINAEAESINDLINPSLPNSPTGIDRKSLLENLVNDAQEDLKLDGQLTLEKDKK